MRITKDIDVQPYATLRAGETGRVAGAYTDEVLGPALWFQMDQYHPGLAAWGNAFWVNCYTALEDLAAIEVSALYRPLMMQLIVMVAEAPTDEALGGAVANIVRLISG
jgi:hypothetical protein